MQVLVQHVVIKWHDGVPLGLKVPVDKLDAGSYRLELRALDSAGNKSPIRAADFVVD